MNSTMKEDVHGIAVYSTTTMPLSLFDFLFKVLEEIFKVMVEKKPINEQTILKCQFGCDLQLVIGMKALDGTETFFEDIFYDITKEGHKLLANLNIWLRKRVFENGSVEWSLKRVNPQEKDQAEIEFNNSTEETRILASLNSQFKWNYDCLNDLVEKELLETRVLPTSRISLTIDEGFTLAVDCSQVKEEHYTLVGSLSFDMTNASQVVKVLIHQHFRQKLTAFGSINNIKYPIFSKVVESYRVLEPQEFEHLCRKIVPPVATKGNSYKVDIIKEFNVVRYDMNKDRERWYKELQSLDWDVDANEEGDDLKFTFVDEKLLE